MMIPLAWALMGFGTGCLLSAFETADGQATVACIQHANWQVSQLRHEADVRVYSIHDRWSVYMDPAVRAAYQRRLGR